jgi:hypothetical protein
MGKRRNKEERERFTELVTRAYGTTPEKLRLYLAKPRSRRR